MKYFILVLAATFCLATGRCQDDSRNSINFNVSVDSIAEALVGFAMNHPTIKSAEYLAGFFEYSYKESKTTWMNNIVAQGNLNEFSIKEGSGSDALKQSSQYPRYNFGVSIPLGIFVNNPKATKAALLKYRSTVEQVNVERQNIRFQVLAAWQDYLMNKRLQHLQDEVVHDYEIIYIKNKDAFSKGQVTLDAFNYSSMMYHNELTKQITIESAVHVSEAKIESLIGMSLAEAFNQINARK
jgi:outer membrane protein TolC